MGYYEGLVRLNELIECYISASFIVYTAYIFFGAYLTERAGRMKTTVCLFVIVACSALLQYYIPAGIWRILSFVLPITATARMFEVKKTEYVQYILIFSSISLISDLTVASFLSDLFWVEIFTIYQVHSNRIISMLVARLFVLLISIWIRMRKHRMLIGSLPLHTPFLLLLPAVTVVAGGLLIVFSYNGGIVHHGSPGESVLYICYPFLIFLNILIFQHLDDVEEERAKEKVLDMANKLTSMQAKQYTELLESRDAILKLKHDYKNYLLGVIDEMSRGNYDVALAELHSEYNYLTSQSVVSESMGIVHTVIQSKSRIAAEKGIKIEFEYKDLHHLKISSIDLAVLLGNAVDNAVEAVEKVLAPERRRISVSAKVKNNLLVIVLKNPVSASVDVDHLNTTKTNPFMHGYGVIGMKSIAEKYAGQITFSCENLIFETYILLRNIAQ